MQQATRVVMPKPYQVTTETYEIGSPGPGQVLIETEASAISAGTELAVYTGVHQWLTDPTRTWPRFPFVPGYAGVGRIAALGAGVEGLAEGDRVIWDARHESHALVTVTNDRSLLRPIADHVPRAVAALVPLARFPFAALVQSDRILGQSVAVFGLGPIGQITLRLYAAAGAYPLIGIDPVAHRREVAMRAPGVSTIDPNAGDLRAALREVNGGELPDITVDATGVPNTVKAAMNVVTNGGRVVMVGSPRGIAGDVDFYWDLHGRSITLIGAHGSAIGVDAREKFPFVRERAMRLLVHWVESGKVTFDDLITHDVHASEAATMYDGLLNRRDEFLGVALHW
jgi:2-desacetyl-2-hydroxyethyl bacteriochlorophyllide A dehydrogenase